MEKLPQERIKTLISIILIGLFLLIIISHIMRGFVIFKITEIICIIIIFFIISYIFFVTYYKNKLRVQLIFQIISDFAFQDLDLNVEKNVDSLIIENLDRLTFILSLGMYKNFIRKLLAYGPQMALVLVPTGQEFRILYHSSAEMEVYKDVIEKTTIPKIDRDDLKKLIKEFLSKIKGKKVDKKFFRQKSEHLSLTGYVYEFEKIKILRNVDKSLFWSHYYERYLPPNKKKSHRSRSAAAVPLIYMKKKLGVLIVCDTVGYNFYPSDNIFLAAYAHIISKFLYIKFKNNKKI